MRMFSFFPATLALLGAFLLAPFAVQAYPDAPDANSVLILDSTVTGGAGSVEAVRATSLGLTVEVVTPAQWSAMTTANFATYRALILGDPTCGGSGGVTSPYLDAAIANRTVWSPALTGANAISIGTDPVFHYTLAGIAGAGTLIENGIGFAADIPGKTGLYANLSCYYHGVAPGTPVILLDQIGSFTVTGVGCYNDAHIVAVHPALAGITDAILSGWNCSVHEAFDSFPAGYIPLAIAAGIPGAGSLSFPDGTFGIPYILVSGETVSPIACGNGTVEAPEECDDGNTDNGDGCSAKCTIEVAANNPPDCTLAIPSTPMLWPPNHKMKNILVSGVTDPEHDPITLVITGVSQDEPVQGIGSGNKSPDATIQPDGSVDIRAERTGATPHNGRVYSVAFTATDPSGLSCSSSVQVCVPHDQGNANECLDDAPPSYDSTLP